MTYSALCKTWYFFTANIFQAGAAGFFIWVGWRVKKTVNEYNKHTNALLSSNNSIVDEDQNDVQAAMEMQFRLKAVRNMSIVIWTITLTVGYQTLYTIIYTAFADD